MKKYWISYGEPDIFSTNGYIELWFKNPKEYHEVHTHKEILSKFFDLIHRLPNAEIEIKE